MNTTVPKAKSYGPGGEDRGEIDLPAGLFAAPVKQYAVHECVKAFLRNQRQGTAATKNRSAVRGSNSKPWRQKGTGRARAGTAKSPLWVGGGTIFGPSPRDYTVRVPKKVRRTAFKSVLTDKADNDRVRVMELPRLEKPRTKVMASILRDMEIAEGSSVLFLIEGKDDSNVEKSLRNLKGVACKRAILANTYDILQADYIVLTGPALESLQEVFDR